MENIRFQRKSDFNSGSFKQADMRNMDDSEVTDEEKIQELEIIIREYDREFNRKPFTGTESSLSFSLADYYQLHLGIEQIRIPEIFFQPSIIGIDQAGIAETLEMVLSCYSHQTQLDLVQNVFLTGGCVCIPGFKERIQGELLAMRPFQSHFHVQLAN
ncbi:actin-related protein 5-like [Centruroides sculpturatus]|uniref:actin-related protein 5-like n=1 Tax=Centruroides sculpturatus TaxID=218467 RepID=UPI000C6CE58E|nr:actin-related protein 5-like [Centruroides sculpturatus]